tara:strand:- start:292 stop:774 length:483 start_codon:yes stop_codon:yes gene_type:complete
LGLHWQFGVVQNAVSAVVTAPAGLKILDINDNARQVTLNCDIDIPNPSGGGTLSAGTDFDVANNASFFISTGTNPTLTVKAFSNSGTGGTATTHSWTLSQNSGPSETLTNTTGSSANYTNGTIEITSVARTTYAMEVEYQGSNSAGSDTALSVQFAIRGL